MGESGSLSFPNISSLGVGDSVEWAVGREVLSRGSSPLVITKVSALHAAEYRCSDSTDRRRVRIRLQSLEGECENTGPNPELSLPPFTSCLMCVLV